MPSPVETCEACRFDGDQYDLPDALGTLRALGPMWRMATEGLSEDVLQARPAPEVWSAAEYADHSAAVVELNGLGLGILLSGEDIVLDAPPEQPEPPAGLTFADALARLQGALMDLHDGVLPVSVDDPGWERTLTIGDQVTDGSWLLRHVVHDVSHHLMDLGRGLHLLGAGAPTQEGTVAQLNISGGGVPKKPVEVAEVGDRGVVGDRQADRKHHGRPLQALCLWSTDVIDALRAEGHPIAPGLAGENITVSGIEWSTLRPGTQVLIGEVLVEISAWSTPCAKNAAWFVDRDFRRMDHDRHPGWSRAYAWVREPGSIRAGDPVVVEP